MFVKLLDLFLIALAGITLAVIAWKAVELTWPRWLGIETPVSTRGPDFDEFLEKLERGMVFLATVAAAAPFIGLGATVLHIMEALSLLKGTSPEATVIAGPIATALNSTLLGLASAVPAAVAYNQGGLIVCPHPPHENRWRPSTLPL
jgi:biopolymer transport protein ExbB/TolQ